MKDSDKPKLVIAIVILVAALGVMAWYFGIFGGGGTATPENAPDVTPHATGGPHMAPGAAPPK